MSSRRMPVVPGSWGFVKKLLAPNPAFLDRFGSAVAVSGDTIIVGYPYDDGPAENTGAAYVFRRDQGGPDNWGLAGKLTAPSGWLDNFGHAVAMSGETAVVGALFHDGAAGRNSGAAYVFDLTCPPCPADADGSGTVDLGDVMAVLTSWGPCEGCPADVTGDGTVDVEDLVAVIIGWGGCP